MAIIGTAAIAVGISLYMFKKSKDSKKEYVHVATGLPVDLQR